eukprot:Gb_30472 [translate_table: standard]
MSSQHLFITNKEMMCPECARDASSVPLASAYVLTKHKDGHWEWENATGVPLSPRYQHTTIFVNARLNVFGGALGGRHNANAVDGEASVELTSRYRHVVAAFGEPPSTCFAHVAIVVGTMVVIKGGIGPVGLSSKDLHVLDLIQFLLANGENDGKWHLVYVWALDTAKKPYEWRKLELEGVGLPPCMSEQHCGFDFVQFAIIEDARVIEAKSGQKIRGVNFVVWESRKVVIRELVKLQERVDYVVTAKSAEEEDLQPALDVASTCDDELALGNPLYQLLHECKDVPIEEKVLHVRGNEFDGEKDSSMPMQNMSKDESLVTKGVEGRASPRPDTKFETRVWISYKAGNFVPPCL